MLISQFRIVTQTCVVVAIIHSGGVQCLVIPGVVFGVLSLFWVSFRFSESRWWAIVKYFLNLGWIVLLLSARSDLQLGFCQADPIGRHFSIGLALASMFNHSYGEKLEVNREILQVILSSVTIILHFVAAIVFEVHTNGLMPIRN
jgi:hypothetical protein